jgi:PPP family 3-phenylpropionic acid transporter
VVLAVTSLAGVVATPAWSHLADTRFGSVHTLLVASLASSAAALALAFTDSHLGLTILAVVLLGAATGPGTALADTIALGHLGTDRVTEYGSIRLWASIGWAVAAIVFGAWFDVSGLSLVPVAFAAGALAYAAVLTRLPAVRPETPDHASRLGSIGEAFRTVPRLVPFLIGLLLVSVSTWAAWSFVPLRIGEGGGGPLLVGLSAGLAAVIEIPIMRSSGWLARHVGLRTLYAAGCAIYAAMMVAWAFLSNPTAVAMVLVVRGTGFGLTYVALVVMTGRLVPSGLQNTGQGLMQMVATGFGPIIGTAVGGFVYERLGPPTLFASTAVLVSVGATIVWITMSGEGFRRLEVPVATEGRPDPLDA